MNYKLSDFNKTSVYLLKKDGVVVYVGSSKNGFYRALSHAYNKPVKDFDEIELIDCELDDLIELETELIIKYQLIYNNTIPSKNYITLKSFKEQYCTGRLIVLKMFELKNKIRDAGLMPKCVIGGNVYYLLDELYNLIKEQPN